MGLHGVKERIGSQAPRVLVVRAGPGAVPVTERGRKEDMTKPPIDWTENDGETAAMRRCIRSARVALLMQELVQELRFGDTEDIVLGAKYATRTPLHAVEITGIDGGKERETIRAIAQLMVDNIEARFAEWMAKQRAERAKELAQP